MRSLSRGQVNFTGLYYAVTMKAHMPFESWLERDVAMTLDFDPEVVASSRSPSGCHGPLESTMYQNVARPLCTKESFSHSELELVIQRPRRLNRYADRRILSVRIAGSRGFGR